MQTDTITIQGIEFTVPVRYNAGHVLTEAESGALNQTYHENLANNFRKKLKDALGEESSLDDDTYLSMQAELDAYAAEYEFGVRIRSAAAPSNPIEKEAFNLAKSAIRTKLKTIGRKADADAIAEAARTLIADRDGRGAQFWELAAKRVEEAKAAASAEFSDLLDGMPEKSAE